jgi:acetylornithine deacetylase/succinyl-diaminopimelate desuccinylase-like protein
MSILLWRLTITPLLVGLVTLVARRYGSRAAGLVMGLPLTSGPILLFLAIDHGAAFGAAVAEGAVGAAAGVGLFCGAYALIARRLGWRSAVTGAIVAFCAGSGAFQCARLGSGAAALLSLAVMAVLAWGPGIWIAAPRGGSRAAPAWDLPARMVVSFAALALVMGLAPRLGSRLCGVLSSLPVLTAVMAVFTHRRGDRPATLALLSGTVRGEIGSVAFFAIVSLLSGRLGIASTYVIATGSALLINAAWALTGRKRAAITSEVIDSAPAAVQDTATRMRLSSFILGCALTAACAPPSAPTSPPARATVSGATSLEAERRAILAELISFDTSHGHETDALRPIAKRFEDAGVHADILEAAPGRGNLVARLKGSGAKRPLLLMAHIDVVPVEGQPWTVPPFKLTEKDGFLYGRGVNDDKGMASAIIATALELARTHAALARDVIVMLTAGEETGGVGVPWLLEHHRELIDAELALDEGGSIAAADDQSRIQGVEVMVAEKLFQSYRLVVKGPGGHSSIPPTDVDPVANLARALERVTALRFPPRALAAVKDALSFLATREKPPVKDALERIAASAPTVAPADEKILSSNRFYNALIHTTCVTTMLRAAPQENVLPTTAEAVVNCRILPDETPEQVKAVLERTIGDPAVTVIQEPRLRGASSLTSVDAPVVDALRKAAARWPGAVVYPSMLVGASDSQFLRAAGIHSYGLHTTPTSLLEDSTGHTAHGPDERAPTKWVDDGVRFLRDVVLNLAQ